MEKSDVILDLTSNLSKSFGNILDTLLNTDVTFIVDDQVIEAHRLILAAQSHVFRELLLGNHFRESLQKREPIPLPDKHAPSFRTFLRFLYTGKLNMTQLSLHEAVNILQMAHEFQVNVLFEELTNHLKEKVSLETVTSLFDAALVLDAEKLAEKCRKFMCENSLKLIAHPTFLALSAQALVEVLRSDEFEATELEILLAVSQWHCHNDDVDFKKIVESTVRLEIIKLEKVQLSDLADVMEKIIENQIDLKKLTAEHALKPRFRKYIEKVNQASPKLGGKVLKDGECVNPYYCIDGSFLSRPVNGTIQGFETHHSSGHDRFIVIELAKVSYVDSMYFVAVNYSESSFIDGPSGCKIETSADKKNWWKLIDCNDHLSVQRRLLTFAPRHVLYVKLNGKAWKVFQAFYVLHFECPATSVRPSDIELHHRLTADPKSTVMYELDLQRSFVMT